jgi:MFS family permease
VTSGRTETSAAQPVRAALAALVGTSIEWYDFYVYATASALVFGPLFFSNQSAFVGTLASFGTFAAGFFARPIGGLVFGRFGDRFGRKKALVVTLLMMGVATIAIGLLPTYAVVGAWAPVALVALRLLQGVAVGGEWGGAVLLAAEHAPKGRSMFFASFAQLGSPAGLILSLLAFRAAGLLEPKTFLAWGWRLPFLASVVMLVIGFVIRLRVAETPEFERIAAEERAARAPIGEALRTSLTPIVLATGANTIGIASVYLFNTFMIAYATKDLGLPRADRLHDELHDGGNEERIEDGGARLAEAIGNELLFLQLALVWAMLAPYALFHLVDTGHFWMIALGLGLNVVGSATFYAVVAGYLAGCFPTRVRYTSISIAYQFCGAIAGGLTPLVGTLLVHAFPGHWWPIAAFATAMAALSFVCVTAMAPFRRLQRASDAAFLD